MMTARNLLSTPMVPLWNQNTPSMPSLTLKNLPDELLESLRETAKEERRSLTAQAIRYLEEAEREAKRARLLRRYSKPNMVSREERRRLLHESHEELARLREGKPPVFGSEEEIDEIIDDRGYDPSDYR